MGAFRPTGMRNEVIDSQLMPGDVVIGGESLLNGALVTIGAGTLTGAIIATGIINRTGPTAGYTDTTDTSTAILAALAGNSPGPVVEPGSTFRLRFINTVAFLMTLAAGTGVKLGAGSTLNAAASTWREYILTILNSSPPVTLNCSTTNASAAVTFNLPPGMVALPIGPGVQAINITPGMTVSGTGITAGTTVIGVTNGQGGITGVTLSANATATNNPVSLTFSPTIQIDSIGSGTL